MSYKNRANFKPLSEFIKRVNIKNKDGKVSELKGINIDKFFMPSVANVVGTDLTRYKVVKPQQFACNRMHVGRDYRLPIAVSKFDNNIIVSPAYDVFEIIDTNELSPEYLMMWFSRSEFDRNCWFYTDTDVRGKLGWDSFCEIELPIPSIEKQNEIVKEYNIVINRIKLNEQFNQKLEETAQALYKHWFVDFEFPDKEGKPYKSSGGEMVYNEDLDKEIPVEWEVLTYEDVFDFKTGKLNSNAAVEDGTYPFFTCSSETYRTDTYSFDCEALLLAGNNASAKYPFKYFKGKFDAYQRTYVLTTKHLNVSIYQGYYEILSQLEGFKGTSSGTATKFLTMKILNPLKLIVPNYMIYDKYKELNSSMFDTKLLIEFSTEKLIEIKYLLLSKMTKIEAEKEMV